jgi:non-ribosomal peptide synthetase component F
MLSMDLLDAGEHARLDEWGNRAVLTQPATGVSIPALFATQVAPAPEAVALSCGECWWTYRELEESANRSAHLLAGHGVGPGGAAVRMDAEDDGALPVAACPKEIDPQHRSVLGRGIDITVNDDVPGLVGDGNRRLGDPTQRSRASA